MNITVNQLDVSESDERLNSPSFGLFWPARTSTIFQAPVATSFNVLQNYRVDQLSASHLLTHQVLTQVVPGLCDRERWAQGGACYSLVMGSRTNTHQAFSQELGKEERVHAERDASGSDHPRPHRERAERIAIMEACPYEMSEAIGKESIVMHQGEAISVNVSTGGMLLLMDQSPRVDQVLQVRIPRAAKAASHVTLAEVRWTRQLPIESGGTMHLVGVRFLFAPYSYD